MDEPEREPPPHAGERLTREDVLRLIEEHSGPEDLDLEQADLEQADLSELDLHGADLSYANLQGALLSRANFQGATLAFANLQGAALFEANLQDANLVHANLQGTTFLWADLQGANLRQADLQRASLRQANLQGATLSSSNLHGADLALADLRGATLWHANLQRASFISSNLQGANLERADLRRARLAWASLRDANLEGVAWGDYKLGEEIASDFHEAASAYRALKQRHTELGMYDIAGEFHYREMEARRKLAKKERRLPYALALGALGTLYGYGERLTRLITWAAAVVFGLALVHWAFGTVSGGFLDALYYSAVSFTALGYGASDSDPQGWAGRFLGAAESFMGVFMMALFLVTFTRKMTR